MMSSSTGRPAVTRSAAKSVQAVSPGKLSSRSVVSPTSTACSSARSGSRAETAAQMPYSSVFSVAV